MSIEFADVFDCKYNADYYFLLYSTTHWIVAGHRIDVAGEVVLNGAYERIKGEAGHV